MSSEECECMAKIERGVDALQYHTCGGELDEGALDPACVVERSNSASGPIRTSSRQSFLPSRRRVCVTAATSSTRRGRRRGLFNMLPFLKCGCGGSWSPSCGHASACLTLGSLLQSVGPGRPVTLGATVVLPKRFSPRLCVRGKRNRAAASSRHAPTPDAQTGKVLENAPESRNPD